MATSKMDSRGIHSTLHRKRVPPTISSIMNDLVHHSADGLRCPAIEDQNSSPLRTDHKADNRTLMDCSDMSQNDYRLTNTSEISTRPYSLPKLSPLYKGFKYSKSPLSSKLKRQKTCSNENFSGEPPSYNLKDGSIVVHSKIRGTGTGSVDEKLIAKLSELNFEADRPLKKRHRYFSGPHMQKFRP